MTTLRVCSPPPQAGFKTGQAPFLAQVAGYHCAEYKKVPRILGSSFDQITGRRLRGRERTLALFSRLRQTSFLQVGPPIPSRISKIGRVLWRCAQFVQVREDTAVPLLVSDVTASLKDGWRQWEGVRAVGGGSKRFVSHRESFLLRIFSSFLVTSFHHLDSFLEIPFSNVSDWVVHGGSS